MEGSFRERNPGGKRETGGFCRFPGIGLMKRKRKTIRNIK
jgi:hypothetical protein